MQYRELRWRKLIPGALTVIGLVMVALVILVRVGLGNMPGRKFTMYALTDQARGILGGSDIWIAGQRVGVVSDVEFLPAVAATAGAPAAPRILLELAILEQYQHLVGRNSRAQIRAGSRFLGNPVVHVALGSPGDATIRAGDTIITIAQFDAEVVMAKAEEAMQIFPLVVQDLQTVLAGASGLDSLLSLVALSDDSSGVRSPLRDLMASLGQLSQRLDGGSLGLFMNDPALSSRMKSVSASTATLSGLYDIEGSSLGRFLRDSALFTRIDSLAQRLGTVMGTLKTRYDPKTGSRAAALSVELDRLTASLKALRGDARKHPFRYIVF